VPGLFNEGATTVRVRADGTLVIDALEAVTEDRFVFAADPDGLTIGITSPLVTAVGALTGSRLKFHTFPECNYFPS
jgi:hypothetical protein